MKYPAILRAIGCYEIICGLFGGGFALWLLVHESDSISSFIFIYILIAYSLFTVCAGCLLFSEKTVGVWLSILVQLIAIPTYVAETTTYKFNSMISFSFDYRVNGSGVGVDLVAVVLFAVLIFYRNRRSTLS